MVSPQPAIPCTADITPISTPRASQSPLPGGGTTDSRPDLAPDILLVYASSLAGHEPRLIEGGEGYMSSGRGGSSESSSRAGPSSAARRQSQRRQQQQQQGSYPSLNSPQEPQQPQSYNPYSPTQYPHASHGYPPAQYMISSPPPPPPPPQYYHPPFHEQQSSHSAYPLAMYPGAQYAPPQPYQQQYSPYGYASHSQPAFSPQHQHPHPPAIYTHNVYAYQHASPNSAHAESEGSAGGGTWWYVPGPSQQQHPAPSPQNTSSGGARGAYTPYYGSAEYEQHQHHPPPARSPPPPMSPIHAAAPQSQPSSSSSAASPRLLPSMRPRSREREERERRERDGDRRILRREYHPAPPADRSEWVMWVGNVSPDATHQEVWSFFTQDPPVASNASTTSSGSGSGSGSTGTAGNGVTAGTATAPAPETERDTQGVLSIFLITRSNCAFVNYESEARLDAAIARYNGVSLRPHDPRCPRLVCRMRRKDDDLRAGVGGQRGMGMHARWVKEKAKEREKASTGDDSASSASASVSESDPGTPSSASDAALSLAGLSIASSEGEGSGSGAPVRSRPPPRPHGSNSSGSHASTDSSMLRRHFPQRYFILKSLTRDDLDQSVQTGVWATQKHNEGVLDRAFRTSEDVFLIFSVNKSGEFYGYARMAGPTGNGTAVAWARRDAAGSSVPPPQPAVFSTPGPMLSGDGHYVGDSPLAMSNSSPAASKAQSAPAVLGHPHRMLTVGEPMTKHSLDHHLLISAPTRGRIELDEMAPIRAIRVRPSSTVQPGPTAADSSTGGHALGAVPEEPPSGVSGLGVPPPSRGGPGSPDWGASFPIEWVCTERLPFQRTRNIRNPWNHDREIKVSRDGTELEPGVGQALLEEWQAYRAEVASGAGDASTAHSSSASASSSRSRASGTRSARAGSAGGGGGGGGTHLRP